MNLRRLAARVATAGAVGALGAGALAGVAVAPASADASAVEYTCSALGSSFPVMVQPTGLPQLTPGQSVSAGSLNMPVGFTLSRAVLDGMAGKGINSVGISTDSFSLSLGASPVALTGLTVPRTSVPATGDLTLTAPGKNGAFTAPAAGTYDLTVPAAFTATVDTNLIPLSATCAIADPATAKVGSVVVADEPAPMQDSTTTATGPKTVLKGAAVKLSIKVTADMSPTGTVTAMEGSKTLGTATLANGAATITVKGLKPGKHRITVAYSGDDFTKGSASQPVTVTVKKKKK